MATKKRRRRARRRQNPQLGFWGKKKTARRDTAVTVNCVGKGSYTVIGTRAEATKVANATDRARCTVKLTRI